MYFAILLRDVRTVELLGSATAAIARFAVARCATAEEAEMYAKTCARADVRVFDTETFTWTDAPRRARLRH